MLLQYACAAGHLTRVIREKPGEAPPCKVCKEPTSRCASGPGVAVMETLDNGAMDRALTRYADAERLYAERRASADPNSGGAVRVDRAK